MKAKKPIGLKEIFDQLKADIIGKDSHRGVTLTYSWLANQFGHISLGVIPTITLYSFMRRYFEYDNVICAAIIVSILWLLFEIFNLLFPLIFKKPHKSKKFHFNSDGEFVFMPKWKNLIFDTFTDLCFFWIGALVTGFLIAYDETSSILQDSKFFWVASIITLLALALFFFSKYWYVVKMYQNYAYYPFQFRLSQWVYGIDDEDIEKVKDFLRESEQSGKHLLVFGAKKSGKTSLGVGIANELSIKRKACTYTTGIKLYSMFFEHEQSEKLKYYWSWREADLLVIDDINPGDPINEQLVTPDDFLNYIDCLNPEPNSENRVLVRDKNIIWILGNENVSLFNQWERMLISLGIAADNINSVSL